MSLRAEFGARWTPEDEANFQRLAERREKTRTRNEARVQTVVAKIRETIIAQTPPPEPPVLPESVRYEDFQLARAMILHAEDIRDALNPFDSHVRMAPGLEGASLE